MVDINILPPTRLTYVRIDTTNSQPYLQGPSSSEMVIMALLAGREKGWFDVVDFVVLPSEVQLMLIPKTIQIKDLIAHFEAEVHPYLSILKPIVGKIFDPEFYQEKFSCIEDVKQRRRWMYMSPIRLGLAQAGTSYVFSSANPRYQDIIVPVKA